MSTPLVVLIGPPGAGKSTVGRALAERRGVAFRDTDLDVETSSGQAVADIFIESGEAAFRSLERDAVAAALDEHDGVLAVGGGAVLDPDTRDRLAGKRVVFLDVGLSAAVDRTGLNQARPLLAVPNPRSTLKHMLDERRPIYEELATAVVLTDGQSVDQVVDQVEAAL